MGNQVKPVRCLLAGIGHGWLHCVGHALLPNAPCKTLGEVRVWEPEIILKVALEWGNSGTQYLTGEISRNFGTTTHFWCLCVYADSCPCLDLSLNLSQAWVWQLLWQLSNAMLLFYAICIPERCSSASLLQMLLAAHCSSVLLLCCCNAAQVQLVGLCNHWVRLHYCTLPRLLKLLLGLGLGWRVQTFFVSLSWVSIAWVP